MAKRAVLIFTVLLTWVLFVPFAYAGESLNIRGESSVFTVIGPEATQDNLINSNEETIEPNGLPRWLTKKIVQAVADGIRIGINSKYVKKMVRDYFDEEMEEAFFKHANKIAGKLDYFAESDELARECK